MQYLNELKKQLLSELRITHIEKKKGQEKKFGSNL